MIFAAHSLPERMIEQGDPYADQLAATAGKVAERLGLGDWHLAYQSVSAAAREPWLGPSVDQVMERLAADGATSVLVDPIGFISDHVETLYDNDIEHRAHAEALRTRLPPMPMSQRSPRADRHLRRSGHRRTPIVVDLDDRSRGSPSSEAGSPASQPLTASPSAGAKVTSVEKSPRLGGKVITEHSRTVSSSKAVRTASLPARAR